MKMKKAQNELLAMITKPKNLSSKYHASPANKRTFPKNLPLTQSFIQPCNPLITKKNVIHDDSEIREN